MFLDIFLCLLMFHSHNFLKGRGVTKESGRFRETERTGGQASDHQCDGHFRL